MSYYENGKREPDKETLTAIANHFMVSVGELLHSDLAAIGSITVDKDALWKNIDIILPIVYSKKALENEHFKKAFDAHKTFYEQLRQVNLDGIDNIGVCIEKYLEVVEEDDIEAEVAANFIALWYLLMVFLKLAPVIMKNKPAALRQVAAKDEKARKIIESTDSSFEDDAKAILKDFDDEGINDMIPEKLTAIKRSKDWSDLADYYLALQYIWNLVDNDLDWGFNQRIGTEMMEAFVTVKNVYAARFVKYSFDAIRGMSSQSVDDKQ